MAAVVRKELFQLKPIEGKGYGLVAAKVIHPGELIIAESPMIQIGLTPEGDLVGKFNREKMEFVSPILLKALNQLPDNDLYRFYCLSDSCSRNIAKDFGITLNESSSKNLKTDYGIVKTNSFSVNCTSKTSNCEVSPEVDQQQEDDDRTCLALFPTIARINHSCQPNCNHYWSGGQFKIRSIQKIHPGQEISISYMSPLQRSDFHNRRSRQKILTEEFGFKCACDLCQINEDDLERNDADREQLLEIEQSWSTMGKDPMEAFRLAKKQFSLGEKLRLQPGLQAYISLHCVESASLVLSTSDSEIRSSGQSRQDVKQQGLAFASKAKEQGAIAYGYSSDESSVFDQIYSSYQRLPDDQLLSAVQDGIASLRDIDRKQ